MLRPQARRLLFLPAQAHRARTGSPILQARAYWILTNLPILRAQAGQLFLSLAPVQWEWLIHQAQVHRAQLHRQLILPTQAHPFIILLVRAWWPRLHLQILPVQVLSTHWSHLLTLPTRVQAQPRTLRVQTHQHMLLQAQAHRPQFHPPIQHPSPSPIPSSSILSPPNYPPTSPSPSPIPSSSISSPPSYPPTSPSPSPFPSSSISSPPSYPPTSPSPGPSPAPSGLSVGYYMYSCANAESIVREAVKSAIASNNGTGAGLIRLFFHDCFVEGCDASVLLNTTGSAQPTERACAPNLSLRGFDVIDAAKAELEDACPGVVSCADIVAFAGRDATYFLSGKAVDFDMPAGRYDGRVSLDSAALANLPPPFASLQELKDMFAAKGLDTEDMVTLSGAHTVGRSHCSSFSDRLPPNASDMDPAFAAELQANCTSPTGADNTVPQDFETPNVLDSQYYRNVLNHEVLFGSDAALLASNQTAGMVRDNAFTPGLWEAKFKAAMVKMGRAGVKTSTDGEIRKKCWMVN
ncbi:hypothetical protein PVAP13_2NG649100 [Panicum virgatum]|uniref:peroxidase n=1 Tax=Panicum virgatum TaxID=38727 RepID=A0A8T0VUR8_PANVG|nr:hypothetical protein PVAP13_2NG649100 [Panicum virgatum]